MDVFTFWTVRWTKQPHLISWSFKASHFVCTWNCQVIATKAKWWGSNADIQRSAGRKQKVSFIMSKCANNKMATKGQERKISKENKIEEQMRNAQGTGTGVQGRSQINQQRGEGEQHRLKHTLHQLEAEVQVEERHWEQGSANQANWRQVWGGIRLRRRREHRGAGSMRR